MPNGQRPINMFANNVEATYANLQVSWPPRQWKGTLGVSNVRHDGQEDLFLSSAPKTFEMRPITLQNISKMCLLRVADWTLSESDLHIHPAEQLRQLFRSWQMHCNWAMFCLSSV